ncbi:uncharacterized protein LOC134239266, partial [Saccostrea cucullata]|uniref:uncharacterized protein LOC134239266 n=1 Tax=Saccostrea cuccullata TaxID=36930 RepID=UPI002ED08DF8
ICPYDCGGSVRGKCETPGKCKCNPGYVGEYCLSVGSCSHLRPCFPGYCKGDNTCQCLNNFSPQNSKGIGNCLNFPSSPDHYYPAIEQSTIDFGYYSHTKNMLMFNMTIDSAMSEGNKEVFWTNRRDLNIMIFTFQSIFSSDTLNLPTRPGYVIQHEFGIVEADINVKHKDFSGRVKYNTTLPCDGVSRDSPIHDILVQCRQRIAPFDVRFDSGDT